MSKRCGRERGGCMRITYMCQNGFSTCVGGDDHRNSDCNGVIVSTTGHSVLRNNMDGHMTSNRRSHD